MICAKHPLAFSNLNDECDMCTATRIANVPRHTLECPLHGEYESMLVDRPCERCDEIRMWKEEKESQIKRMQDIERDLTDLMRLMGTTKGLDLARHCVSVVRETVEEVVRRNMEAMEVVS